MKEIICHYRAIPQQQKSQRKNIAGNARKHRKANDVTPQQSKPRYLIDHSA